MTTTKPETQLTCGKIRIRDFKRIELFDVETAGKHLLLSGPNGSGKSSVLDGLLSLIGLVKSKEIPEPIRDGAAKAELDCELIDRATREVKYRLHQEWEGDKRIYTVHDANGKPVAIREFQKLIDPYLCNPVELLTMRPQDQVDEVLRVFRVEPPVAQVQEITGETHDPREGESASAYMERLSADGSGIYYDRRREAHRVKDLKEAAFEEKRQRTIPVDEETDGLTVAELLVKRKPLEVQQAEYQRIKAEEDRTAVDFRSKFRTLQERKGQLQKASDEARQLEQQLKLKQAEVADLQERIAKGEKICDQAGAASRAAAQVARETADPSADIASVDAEISAAQANEERRIARQIAVQELDRLEQEAKAADAEYQRADFIVQELRQLRRRLLEGVDMGIKGLEIGNGELRLGGVPFRQGGTAERIDAACAIAFHKRPGARIAVVDDGEHLDSAHRERVVKRATEHGCQLCLAVVQDGEELAWQLVEGT